MSMLHLCSVSEMSYFRNSECQEDPQEDNDLKEQLATYVKAMTRSEILDFIQRDFPQYAADIIPRGGGGTCQNFDRDARPIFFGFEIWPNPIFLANFLAIFLGFAKFPLFFGR